jgi:ectoine hydroxylase-related dioxygenase (phytanoyl-CoA dioxygenase family)
VLTTDERVEFEARGVVRLRGAVDPEVAGALRERLLAFIAERRLAPESPPPGFALTASGTAALLTSIGFEEVWGARVFAVLDDLLGRGGWHVPKQAGQMLAMTFPRVGAPWELPHKSWHLDYTAPGAARGIPGVQVFLCLDEIAPGGGGTLVAAGVHRLIDAIRRREGSEWRGRSLEIRRALQREVPWIRDVATLRAGEDRIARFMAKATRVKNVALQVVELVGEPGDVYAMHPWMLHAASPNCGSRPRLGLTERIHARRAPS